MYKSSMKVSELLALVRGATDIAPVVDDEYYLMWLSSLEALLYTGVIRSTGLCRCEVTDGYVDLAAIEVSSEEESPRGCDVRGVFLSGRELERVDAGSYARHPERPCFYAEGERLCLNSPYGVAGEAQVVYLRRPKVRTSSSLSAYVALPDEFLPMAVDYLVGCAYALICEDTQAANRFAAYNAAMDDFALWHEKNKGGKS